MLTFKLNNELANIQQKFITQEKYNCFSIKLKNFLNK